MRVRVYNAEGLELPQYKTPQAAGVDFRSAENVEMGGYEIRPIRTGLYVEVPEGHQIEVRSRSGMSSMGVVVNNAPGTIDPDYRGEVKVILRNQNPHPIVIYRGDRIAQGVLMQYEQIDWDSVETLGELSETERGDGGLGSTGV